MDHGIEPEEISYVISDPLNHPTIFHPTESDQNLFVDAKPPASLPLPGVAAPRRIASSEDPYSLIPFSAPEMAGLPTGVNANPPHSAAVVAADTPLPEREHVRRSHIIDMESRRTRAAEGISTTTAGDAMRGAAGGAGIGIGLGVLLGLAAVVAPGIGLVAGGGALVAGLAAATGIAGGIAGGITGYLVDLGVPAERAREISNRLESGAVLLHINVSGAVSEAEIIRLIKKYRATSAEAY